MESCSMALALCCKICTLRRRPCDSIITVYQLHTFARQRAHHLLAPVDKSHLSSLDETASRFANSTSTAPETRFNELFAFDTWATIQCYCWVTLRSCCVSRGRGCHNRLSRHSLDSAPLDLQSATLTSNL